MLDYIESDIDPFYEKDALTPLRFSFITFNTWGNQLWPERKEPLQKLMLTIMPDVVVFQEITQDIIDSIKEVRPNHEFINKKMSIL